MRTVIHANCGVYEILNKSLDHDETHFNCMPQYNNTVYSNTEVAE